jgi:hypothetical protein|tara:strand:+ start:242 stop:1558 length:1317 start_codon:yes stop_codon:yes gene_type:complete
MPNPTLTPASTTSTVILTSTGSADGLLDTNSAAHTVNYPLGIYADASSVLYDANFLSGASDQVAYTYKKLGGDVLDIEITVGNVYSAYEEAVLEYSYQINIHQAKNVLSDLLGMSTGTFDNNGQMTGGDASGSEVNLSFPKYEFRYARRISEGLSREAAVGGNVTMYSASFSITGGQQDYDLQTIISRSAMNNSDEATGSPVDYADVIGNKKVRIEKVYYKTPASMWRFYGYYGGLNVVGNLNYYGQYADDTTFELIPAWHNKLQAMAYEDHLWTRLSHYSYELHNNKLRIYPIPDRFVGNMWVQFTAELDGWIEDSDRKHGIEGINNMNTLPFENIPYKNINAIGKHWIRRYALAIAMGMLSQVRGKFSSIPIPGESVQLNGANLAQASAADMQALKEELKSILDEMTYRALAEKDAQMVASTKTVLENAPLLIYQG